MDARRDEVEAAGRQVPRRERGESSARRPARCASPGAAVGLGQDRDRRVRPRARRARRGDRLDRRHRRASSRGAGVAVRAIEDFTGFPEMMDGRVKTLHPRLYAGLLARRDERRAPARGGRAGDRAGRPRVREPVPVRADRRARRRRARQEVIENIDIGGPTMIRAAAKNSAFAAVVVDPADYERVLAELRASGRAAVARRRRKQLAAKAFALHRALRRGDRDAGSRRRPRGLPADLARRLREGDRPALRREPPPAAPPSTRASARADAPARGREPAARQGAVVQQPARPQRGARAGRGVRRAGVRDRQAQQPVRLRASPRAPATPTSAPSRAIPRAPTAA